MKLFGCSCAFLTRYRRSGLGFWTRNVKIAFKVVDDHEVACSFTGSFVLCRLLLPSCFDNDGDAVAPCKGMLDDKPPSLLPIPVDGSGQPLLSLKLTSSPTVPQKPILSLFLIKPLCSRVSCDSRLPLHLNSQNNTQGVQSTNQVLIDNCREKSCF